MPKVSVIIPIYGVEKYIKYCAVSLFEQTLDDIEYIFVDDCSPDKSIEILKKILLDFPNRISKTKIIKHKINKGLPEARNTGILASTGNYIAHCDSDDWVSPTMYEDLYNYAESTKSDLIFCDYTISDGIKKNDRVFKKNIKSNSKSQIISRLLVSSDLNPVWSLFAKRELYNNIVVPIGAQTEDKTFTLQLAWYSSNISYYPFPLYYYRITPNSITNSVSKEKLLTRFEQSKNNIELIIEFLQNKGETHYYEEEIDALRTSLNRFLFKHISDESFAQCFKFIQLPIKRILHNKFLSLKEKLLYIYILTFIKINNSSR